MNARIKELAEQAAGNYTETFNWKYLPQTDKDILEKFAELIVQECICLVLNGKYDSDKYDPNAEFHCGHNIALDSAAEGLQQYFGIKE